MEVGKHISAIRGLIQAHSENDAPYSDEFLYHLFRSACSQLVKQKYDRHNKVSPFSLRYYCIATEASTIHDCGCIEGCTVVKSVYKIPKPLVGRSGDFIRVMTVDHSDIAVVHPSYAKAVNLDPIRASKLHYSIVDGYIVLWNANATAVPPIPRALLVSGYFEDPIQWAEIQACDSSGNGLGTPCYNPKTDDYPIDADLVNAAYSMTLEKLQLPLSIKEDRTNDAV